MKSTQLRIAGVAVVRLGSVLQPAPQFGKDDEQNKSGVTGEFFAVKEQGSRLVVGKKETK